MAPGLAALEGFEFLAIRCGIEPRIAQGDIEAFLHRKADEADARVAGGAL